LVIWDMGGVFYDYFGFIRGLCDLCFGLGGLKIHER